MTYRLLLGAPALAFLASSIACAPNKTNNRSDCLGGKCDTPGFKADRECEEECGDDDECFATCREKAAFEVCELRRDEAMSEQRNGFLREFIRWPCRDADGVTNDGDFDDRGQDYCEYYAVVKLPPAEEDGDNPEVRDIGRLQSKNADISPLDLELTSFQRNVLGETENRDAVVGQCVFTSWFDDTPGPLPSCTSSETCPNLRIPPGKRPNYLSRNSLEYPLFTSLFRMKLEVNSMFAAVDLIDACAAPLEADDPESSDPLNDPYTRGCIQAFDNFGTEARRSDPAICASIGRMTECGCGIDTDGNPSTLEILPDDLAEPEIVTDDDGEETERQFLALSRHLIPKPTEDSVDLRGFPLGTWDDTDGLPPGCRYMETGDKPESRVIVSCDITGEMVLDDEEDLKDACGRMYGDDVVVHVPLDIENIHCFIPEDGTYAASCGPTPWRIGTEAIEGSCENRCNQFNAAASCQCNASCANSGDCCSDFDALCR